MPGICENPPRLSTSWTHYVEALKRNARVANAASQQRETIALLRRQDGQAPERRKLDSSFREQLSNAAETL